MVGLTDFFSLHCCDFTIEILNKYFAVLNSVCNDIDKILDLLPVSVPMSYVKVVMVTRHAFRF